MEFFFGAKERVDSALRCAGGVSKLTDRKSLNFLIVASWAARSTMRAREPFSRGSWVCLIGVSSSGIGLSSLISRLATLFSRLATLVSDWPPCILDERSFRVLVRSFV